MFGFLVFGIFGIPRGLAFWIFGFLDFCICWCSVGSSPSQLLCLGAARLASRQRGCWAAGLLPQGTKHSLRAAKASVPARRNFQALGSKFNIAGRHSEATATAGTKCPSTEAWTSTDFATLRLGRPPGPAKTQGCNICQSASLSAWPNCPSFGCGFRVNASNFEFPPLCLEIPTRCQKYSQKPKTQTLEAPEAQKTTLRKREGYRERQRERERARDFKWEACHPSAGGGLK